MLIYNVTTKVNWSIADDWVQWMKEIHIAGILSTGCFETYRFVKLLEADDIDGPTYAVQYFSNFDESYANFIANFSSSFRKAGIERWGEKFISFSSLMEEVV